MKVLEDIFCGTNISDLENWNPLLCFLCIHLFWGRHSLSWSKRKGFTSFIVLSGLIESNICWSYLAASPPTNRVCFYGKFQVHCLTKTMSQSFVWSVSVTFPFVSSSGWRPGRNHEEPLSGGVAGLCLQAAGDPGEEEVWVCRAGEGFSNSACSICQETDATLMHLVDCVFIFWFADKGTL